MIEENTLIETAKAHAKYYLEEANEFYPFGICLTEENKIVPVSLGLDKEFPNAREVYAELKGALEELIKKGEYIQAAVVSNISIKQGNLDLDAVSIVILQKEEADIHFEYPYVKSTKNEIIYQLD